MKHPYQSTVCRFIEETGCDLILLMVCDYISFCDIYLKLYFMAKMEYKTCLVYIVWHRMISCFIKVYFISELFEQFLLFFIRFIIDNPVNQAYFVSVTHRSGEYDSQVG